jgi:hypothetical protein
LDSDHAGKKERGVRRLTGETESGEGVQKFDVSGALVVNNGEEDVDGMQMRMVNSNA